MPGQLGQQCPADALDQKRKAGMFRHRKMASAHDPFQKSLLVLIFNPVQERFKVLPGIAHSGRQRSQFIRVRCHCKEFHF